MTRMHKSEVRNQTRRTSDSISKEDRQFMAQMLKRMPQLSVQNNPKSSNKEVELSSESGHLENFRSRLRQK